MCVRTSIATNAEAVRRKAPLFSFFCLRPRCHGLVVFQHPDRRRRPRRAACGGLRDAASAMELVEALPMPARERFVAAHASLLWQARFSPPPDHLLTSLSSDREMGQRRRLDLGRRRDLLMCLRRAQLMRRLRRSAWLRRLRQRRRIWDGRRLAHHPSDAASVLGPEPENSGVGVPGARQASSSGPVPGARTDADAGGCRPGRWAVLEARRHPPGPGRRRPPRQDLGAAGEGPRPPTCRRTTSSATLSTWRADSRTSASRRWSSATTSSRRTGGGQSSARRIRAGDALQVLLRHFLLLAVGHYVDDFNALDFPDAAEEARAAFSDLFSLGPENQAFEGAAAELCAHGPGGPLRGHVGRGPFIPHGTSSQEAPRSYRQTSWRPTSPTAWQGSWRSLPSPSSALWGRRRLSPSTPAPPTPLRL